MDTTKNDSPDLRFGQGCYICSDAIEFYLSGTAKLGQSAEKAVFQLRGGIFVGEADIKLSIIGHDSAIIEGVHTGS